MTETPLRKLRVFLCHSSQDKPIVRELYKRLNAEGWIDPWLDKEKLLPGMDWDLEIEKAVEAADAVIVCISSNSVDSEGYIQKELRFALNIALEKPEGSIFIVPLRLDNCEPPRRIRTWHYIDYFPARARDGAWENLKSSLREKAKSVGVAFSVDGREEKESPKPVIQKKETPKPQTKRAMIKPRTDLRFGNHHLLYVSGGNSVRLRYSPDEASEEEPRKIMIQPVKIPYDYWISSSVVSVTDFKRFMKLTKYRRDILSILEKSKNGFVISKNDALAYVGWMNQKNKEQLPAGFVFSLPSEVELIRASVLLNLNYSPDEFVRQANKMLEDIAKFGNKFSTGVFRLAIVPAPRLKK